MEKANSSFTNFLYGYLFVQIILTYIVRFEAVKHFNLFFKVIQLITCAENVFLWNKYLLYSWMRTALVNPHDNVWKWSWQWWLETYYVINRGEWSPSTWGSISGQWHAFGGPQSCRPSEFARRWVKRWAIEKPPLPSNWVSTIITCLK